METLILNAKWEFASFVQGDSIREEEQSGGCLGCNWLHVAGFDAAEQKEKNAIRIESLSKLSPRI
jgi:hypothetical protein